MAKYEVEMIRSYSKIWRITLEADDEDSANEAAWGLRNDKSKWVIEDSPDPWATEIVEVKVATD